MAFITIIIETKDPADGGPDPLREDPYDTAEWMVEEFNDAVTTNGDHGRTVTFISAEWKV